jgi:folate-dependent phosphoribosylglycinamide formyltransferase PurN
MIKKKQNSQNIALFIGSDITSHLIMNFLIKDLIENGCIVYIFSQKNKLNPKILSQLQELFFYERTLLNQYVYPFLNARPLIENAEFTSLHHLETIYHGKLFTRIVEDVNAAETLRFLQEKNITIGISVRWYQKFSVELIDYFHSQGDVHVPFFVNLHPGLLPEYRGVTTFYRSMQNNENNAGFTLHYISPLWDAGDIISRQARPLDYSVSVIENMCLQAASAAKLVAKAVEKVVNNQEISSHPQSKEKAAYYTHPTADDFADFQKKGIQLIRTKEMLNLLVDKFTVIGSAEESALRAELIGASQR